jgi:hypothetical protein
MTCVAKDRFENTGLVPWGDGIKRVPPGLLNQHWEGQGPRFSNLRRVITLKEHKAARKTGQVRRIPVGRRLSELLDQSIGSRTAGPVFLSPSGGAWKVGNLIRT